MQTTSGTATGGNPDALEQAKADIQRYLESCGTRWFQARHTSITKILQNLPLIEHLAREHIRNMALMKTTPAASAKTVCDEDMTSMREFR